MREPKDQHQVFRAKAADEWHPNHLKGSRGWCHRNTKFQKQITVSMCRRSMRVRLVDFKPIATNWFSSMVLVDPSKDSCGSIAFPSRPRPWSTLCWHFRRLEVDKARPRCHRAEVCYIEQLCHTHLCHPHTSVTHTFVNHHLSHTICHTHICHIHLCQPPSFNHHLSYTSLSHTICHTHLCQLDGVALIHFARQAWQLETSTFVSRGRHGTWRHLPAFGVAGVALGHIHLRFAWQVWHLWHWAGSGGALGPVWRLCVAGVALGDIHLRFAWQAWHLVASTFVLRGREALMALGWLWCHTPFF